MLSGRFTKFSKANLNHDLNNDNDQKGEGGVPVWSKYSNTQRSAVCTFPKAA